MYAATVTQELVRRGYQVQIVTETVDANDPHAMRAEEYEYGGMPVTVLKFGKKALSEVQRYTNSSEHHRRFIQSIVEKFRPDVLHVNGISVPALTVAREHNIPSVVTVHHSGAMCSAGDLVRPDGSLCVFAANAKVCIPCTSLLREPKWYTGGIIGKIPRWIYAFVGSRTEHNRRLSFPLRVLRYPWLVERQIEAFASIWQLTDAIIAPSQAIRNLLLRNNIRSEMIRVIPHGVKEIRKKQYPRSALSPIRFGYLGQIAFHKGVHVLFDALSLLKTAHQCEFHVFGNPQTQEEERYFNGVCEQLTHAIPIHRHGFIHHDRIDEAFDRIDVLIVPSLAYEAFGLVVAEAFSAGVPVIVSSSGALPELVADGVNGFIVERNNARALANAMQQCVDDPSIIEKFVSGIPKVQSVSTYVDEVEKVYSSQVMKSG